MAVAFKDSGIYRRSEVLDTHGGYDALDDFTLSFDAPAPELPTSLRQKLEAYGREPGVPGEARTQPEPHDALVEARVSFLLRRAVNAYNQLHVEKPSREAVRLAQSFLLQGHAAGLRRERVEPSVVGGLGITYLSGGRQAYLEIHNNGKIILLLAEEDADAPEVSRLREWDFHEQAERIRVFLNG